MVVYGKGQRREDSCMLAARFSIIPLFGRLKLMEGEEVVRKAQECFESTFQDDKIKATRGRKKDVCCSHSREAGRHLQPSHTVAE